MNPQPDISVVMSVYNGADYLHESMDCILSQEDVCLELIAVNDGSTDRSGQILDEYAQRDDRVRVIHQPNLGLTSALITGCAEARGMYIARHDIGDISLPLRLALQKKALDADPLISFVSCWTEFIGPGNEYLYTTKGTGEARFPVQILPSRKDPRVIDGPTSHPSVMMRTDSYHKAGGYRKEFYFGQDWDLWYRLAEIGTFQMIEQPLYRARVMPNSVSSLNKNKQESIGRLSLESLRLRQKGLSDAQVIAEADRIKPDRTKRNGRQELASGLYFIGECLRRNGDPRAALYLFEALKSKPIFLKAWLRLGQSLLQRGISL